MAWGPSRSVDEQPFDAGITGAVLSERTPGAVGQLEDGHCSGAHRNQRGQVGAGNIHRSFPLVNGFHVSGARL